MNADAVENVINYCTRPNDENVIYIGGVGVDASSAEAAITDFYRVKIFYQKLHGRQVRHYHVSFDKRKEKFTNEQAMAIAYEIAYYYGCEYQTFFGLHTDTNNLHIHFCSNTVSYNGHMYRDGVEDFKLFQEAVNNIINKALCK